MDSDNDCRNPYILSLCCKCSDFKFNLQLFCENFSFINGFCAFAIL